MKINQLLGIHEVEKGVQKIDLSIKRVIIWALIFTNGFAVFYFFAKWLKLT